MYKELKKFKTQKSFSFTAEDTAQAKMEIMRENGINVVDSPAEIGSTVAQVLG